MRGLVVKKIEEVYDLLESAHKDSRERYVFTIKDHHGERNKIGNREEYLEFVQEVAMNMLIEILDADDE